MFKKIMEYTFINTVLGVTFFSGMVCGIVWDKVFLKENEDL